MTYAYVGLGGNTGKPKRQLKTAKRLLARLPAAKLTGIDRQNAPFNAVVVCLMRRGGWMLSILYTGGRFCAIAT